ncbi:MAG TPA: SPFH domain-containing protein, partial [Longimicrobiales bacterium]
RLRGILDEATDKWGVKVNRVEIQDITPPPEVKRAMEQQMRAERDKRAAVLEAEGRKQSEILRAEGDKQAAIARAEGEREARILAADAEAQARLKAAEAEARALERVREALGDSSPAGYLLGVQYIEALKRLGDGQAEKVVYLPYEATALMASLGGIRDLFADGTTRVRRRPVPPGVTPASAG